MSACAVADPGAWFMLLDLDEFLTAPDHSHPRGKWWEHPSLSLSGALRLFADRGADVIRVHWRVYGANGIDDNPTCATIAAFRMPATWPCYQHRIFKTLFRGVPGLVAYSALPAKLPHQQVEHTFGTFSANGTNISSCVLQNDSHSMESPCSIHGMAPPSHGHELLVLRHYVTRSRSEWARKMRLYKAMRTCTAAVPGSRNNKTTRNHLCDATRYSADWANRTFSMLNSRWAPGLPNHHAKLRVNTRCGAHWMAQPTPELAERRRERDPMAMQRQSPDLRTKIGSTRGRPRGGTSSRASK